MAYTSLYTALYTALYPGGVSAGAIFPVPLRFINLGKESQPGSLAASTYTLPCTTFAPADRYAYAPDQAWRAAMGRLYGYTQGIRLAGISLGGPLYADGIGYPMASVLGDYWQAVASGTPGTASSLSASSAAGAGTIVVSSGAGFFAGALISVGATGTTAEEVFACVSCGTSAAQDSDPIYLTLYLPGKEPMEYAVQLCGACAAKQRIPITTQGERLQDRGGLLRGPSTAVTAWDVLGLSPS